MKVEEYREIYAEVFGRSRESGRGVGFARYLLSVIGETLGASSAERDKPQPTVLDVGCGKGDLLELLVRTMCIPARGFDVDDFTIHPGHRVDIGTASALPYESASWDWVLCSHVLEHLVVDEAQHAAAELFRVARQFVVISVGLADCPEHLTVLPWTEWVHRCHGAAASAGFVCIRAEQQGTSLKNIMVWRNAAAARVPEEMCDRKLAQGYPG